MIGIVFDYYNLRVKIKSCGMTETGFALAIGRDPSFVSRVFNYRAYFDTEDIVNSSKLLGIDASDIGKYFFTMKSRNSEA